MEAAKLFALYLRTSSSKLFGRADALSLAGSFSLLVSGLPVGESVKQKEEDLRGHVQMERGVVDKWPQGF